MDAKENNANTTQEQKVENTEENVSQTEEQAPKQEKKKTDKAGKLKKEVEKLEKELKEAKDKVEEKNLDYLRARADYENLKRRTETSNSQHYSDGICKAVLELLPVIDNLERALDAEKEKTPMRQGVEMVLRQARTSLEKLGVEEIEAQGAAFDPNLHNAVMQVPAEEGEQSGMIKTVLMKGYSMDGKVIRHSMVQVTE